MITSRQLRQMYLDFYKSKGHAIIPSSPLVPKEDPTVLFNTAGMQPIVQYLSGEVSHPAGKMLVNSQKCLRTDDIMEVGDNRHATFFEMLGNWSLGDYFKREIIEWSMEFLTSKEWLNLDPHRIFVTVYKGNGSDVPVDNEAITFWQQQYEKLGIVANVDFDYDQRFEDQLSNLKVSNLNRVARIRKLSAKDNWWGLPYRGPCGPCSEMYYLLPHIPLDFETSILEGMNVSERVEWIENNIVEIGNNVFMEFIGEKNENKEPINLEPMQQKNIDTGCGFERFLAVINGYNSIYETDIFAPMLDVINKWSTNKA